MAWALLDVWIPCNQRVLYFPSSIYSWRHGVHPSPFFWCISSCPFEKFPLHSTMDRSKGSKKLKVYYSRTAWLTGGSREWKSRHLKVARIEKYCSINYMSLLNKMLSFYEWVNAMHLYSDFRPSTSVKIQDSGQQLSFSLSVCYHIIIMCGG